MTLIPLSLLGGPVRPSGQWFLHNPRANAELPAGLGSDPAAAGTLSVRGQSIPYHEQLKVRQGLRAQDGGWPRGQAAGTAAVAHPYTEPKGLQVRGQRLPGPGNKAEGCEYALPSFGSERLHRWGSGEAGRPSFCAGSCHLGSPASTGKATDIFSPAAVQELPIASATHAQHSRASCRASASHHASASHAHSVKSTARVLLHTPSSTDALPGAGTCTLPEPFERLSRSLPAAVTPGSSSPDHLLGAGTAGAAVPGIPAARGRYPAGPPRLPRRGRSAAGPARFPSPAPGHGGAAAARAAGGRAPRRDRAAGGGGVARGPGAAGPGAGGGREGAAAAGGGAAAAAAAGAGRGERRPRAHPDLAGDGADAVPAAGAARGVAAGAPGPGLRCHPRRGAAGAAGPGLSPAAPPPTAGREGAERCTGSGSGRWPRGGAAAGGGGLRGREAQGAAAEGPRGHPLHQPPHRRSQDLGPRGWRDRHCRAAGRPPARHGGGHGHHLLRDRGAVRGGGQARRGGGDGRQGAAQDGAKAPADRARARQQPPGQAGQAGRQAVQPAGPEPLHPGRVVVAARAGVLPVGGAGGGRPARDEPAAGGGAAAALRGARPGPVTGGARRL